MIATKEVKPKKTTISTSIAPDLNERLDKYMAAQSVKPSRSAVVEKALKLLFAKAGV